MKLAPRKIELLLLEGTPLGLRYADLKNKTCRALVAPRASFRELLNRPEIQRAGVYLLIGHDESDLPQVYIGEADVLSERLPHHQSKDFWSEIVVFIAQDELLDKASVRYLESILVQRAFRDKQCDLQNGNSPTIKTLSEANLVVMDEFIEDIIFLLTVLGFSIIRSSYQEPVIDTQLLTIIKDGLVASGRETDEGFIVYKDSQARALGVPSIGKSEIKMRDILIEKGVLAKSDSTTNFVFTQDYVFSSPSLSAGVVLGRSSNGRVEWKTKQGMTLREIQESIA